MTLKLPKCGNVRNILENYDIEKSKHEEEKLIKILLTPRYQRQKECELLREANHEIILDKEALEKLLKCHPFPRYQGPFYKPMTCRIYNEYNQDETIIPLSLTQHSSILKVRNVKSGKLLTKMMMTNSQDLPQI